MNHQDEVLDKKSLKNTIIFIAVAAILIAAASMNPGVKTKEGFVNIKVGQRNFYVEIADTQEKQTTGLSNRETIGAAEGMLFVFKEPGSYGFWMKEMYFPLDILWINNDKVIGFFENAPTNQNPLPIYHPPGLVNYVLELPAGSIKKYDIQKGSEFKVLSKN